ncbi:MAG TPA: hypothetical protein VHC72_19105 [Bryobacteraceae bacterium]|nr:hypothetical protein [Bryobacteraceae bacterium]
MLRSFAIGCFALILAALTASAAGVEYLTGMIREISASSLTLDTGDTIAIPKGAQYFSTLGKVKPADFEPGDHVTVEAARDGKGQYTARSITLNKKGSAEDKAEARKAPEPAPAPAPTTPAPAPASDPASRPAAALPAPASAPTLNAVQSTRTHIDDDVITRAREVAFSYSKTLPNYIVKQVTNRYSTVPDAHKAYAWQALDVVTTDLVYENGKERYTNTMVNGKPTEYVEHTGSWSEGEFANMLLAVFSLSSHTDFTDQKNVIIRDRPAWRYEYSVAKENSTWTLHADGKDVKPAYVGSVWIDKATYRVLRLEMAARGIESDFSLDTSESSVDYGFVQIADQQVLLPVDADGLSCTRNSTDCTRERTQYTNYRKFDASSNITFGDSKPR